MFSTAPISHSRIRYPSSSDFSPMMRPAPPTWRKPAGETAFACPHCGTAGEPFHFENRPGVLRCRKCRQNTGLTVGTVMERSHTPLNVWFWAAYLVASQTPACPPCSFSGNLVFRATRRPFKFSTSSARAWCGPTKTGSVDSPRTMLRWTKPGLAGERVGKAVVFTTRIPSPGRSRCVIESRAPSSTTGKTDALARRVRTSPSCSTVAPSRSVGSSRASVATGRRGSGLTIGAAMLASVSAVDGHFAVAECESSSALAEPAPADHPSGFGQPVPIRLIGIHHGVSHQHLRGPTSPRSPSASTGGSTRSTASAHRSESRATSSDPPVCRALLGRVAAPCMLRVPGLCPR